MRYGQKWLDKHRKMGSTYFAQCCPVFISSKNCVKIWPKKKFLDNAAATRCNGGQKAIFLKKMHFSGWKWQFFEVFIFFKIHQWPKLHHIHVMNFFFLVIFTEFDLTLHMFEFWIFYPNFMKYWLWLLSPCRFARILKNSIT